MNNLLSLLLFILGVVAVAYGIAVASLVLIIAGVIAVIVAGVPSVGRLRR